MENFQLWCKYCYGDRIPPFNIVLWARFATFLERENPLDERIPPPFDGFPCPHSTKEFLLSCLVGRGNISEKSTIPCFFVQWIPPRIMNFKVIFHFLEVLNLGERGRVHFLSTKALYLGQNASKGPSKHVVYFLFHK